MFKLIRVLSVAIMIAAGVTSYATQHGIFVRWEVDTLTAAIAPVSIDMLAVICSVAMHLPNVTRVGRVTAVLVLVAAGGGSATANWMAGSTPGAKAVHVAMVACYLLAETVASQVKSTGTLAAVVAAPIAQETPVVQATVTEVTADEAASEDLPEAPVSPAPRMIPERTERRHRTGK